MSAFWAHPPVLRKLSVHDWFGVCVRGFFSIFCFFLLPNLTYSDIRNIRIPHTTSIDVKWKPIKVFVLYCIVLTYYFLWCKRKITKAYLIFFSSFLFIFCYCFLQDWCEFSFCRFCFDMLHATSALLKKTIRHLKKKSCFVFLCQIFCMLTDFSNVWNKIDKSS